MGHPTRRRGSRRRRLSQAFIMLALGAAIAVPVAGYASFLQQHPRETRVHVPVAPARAASRPDTAADGRRGSFSLLTYNVAGLPNWITPLEPASHMPRIAARLNGYDLVLVQEDFSHHAALERGAAHRYQSVPHARANRLVNDGLNRFSHFDFVPLTRQRWTRCSGVVRHRNDCLAAKGFSVAETTLAPGVLVHVYNHHADAGTATEDREARAVQFDQLADYILTHSRGEAVLLAGDTNLDPSSPGDMQILKRFLRRTGLRDACGAHACDAPLVDRVFYRSSAQLRLKPHTWELAEEFGMTLPALSDHHAVRVRMQWQAL